MKSFAFLYPHKEILDFEVEKTPANEIICYNALNACIDERYRQKGFQINYILFDDYEISPYIIQHEGDRTISAGINYNLHRTHRIYPSNNHILNQLDNPEKLVVAGVHMWHCIQKFAKAAHERGIETLVDEDLTEFFGSRFLDPSFKLDSYPNFNPRIIGEEFFKQFMKARKDKPWLYQDY